MRSRSRCSIALAAFIVLVSVWTPLEYPRIADRWFTMPNLLYLSPLPHPHRRACSGVLARHSRQACDARVLLRGRGVRARVRRAGDIGLPYLVPWSLTLWEVAASPESQTFILVGTAVLLPFIIGYTVFVYHTFRGKLREGEGYH